MQLSSSVSVRTVGVVLVAAAVGVAALRASGREVAEAGTLPAVVARPAEDLQVVRLRSGETFGEILARADIGPSEQNALLLAFREQANPRRMRAGTEITLRRRSGEERLRGVDVALNRDETVRLTRDEMGWSSTLVRTPVWTDTIAAYGTIEDLLWNAVIRNPALQDVPPQDRALLIHHLDQVFQWQVDFTRQIQRGDTYRFVFERQVRPDGTMRSGHLLAAELVNQGTAYRAIWFDPNGDGKGTYYDEEGRSVRRAFLLKPLEFRRISSRFSRSRYHPVLKRWRAHKGVDYAAASGTPVMATGDGVVIFRGWKGSLGNLVEIRHPNGFVTRYGHLKGFSRRIRVGTRVKQGDTIAYVGATGLVTGPHLHYEMRRRGEALDPLSIDLPPGDPVPDSLWDRWEEEARANLDLLLRLPGPEDGVPFRRPETIVAEEPAVGGDG